MEAAKTFPDGPAKRMKAQAAKTDDGGGERVLRVYGTGTQKSANPKKNQPRTMRHLG